MPLDEQALRKPGFVEGIRVKLGDGQEWSFPMPRLRLVPARDADGTVVLNAKASHAAKHRATFNAMLKATGAGDDAVVDWIEARSKLAAGLLLDNYELDDDALELLLPLDFGDDNNTVMWDAITAALMGRASPKPTTVG